MSVCYFQDFPQVFAAKRVHIPKIFSASQSHHFKFRADEEISLVKPPANFPLHGFPPATA